MFKHKKAQVSTESSLAVQIAWIIGFALILAGAMYLLALKLGVV